MAAWYLTVRDINNYRINCHAARCERRKQQIILGDSAYSSVPYRRRRHACAGSEARSCSFI